MSPELPAGQHSQTGLSTADSLEAQGAAVAAAALARWAALSSCTRTPTAVATAADCTPPEEHGCSL